VKDDTKKCSAERGSLACEECDNWFIVELKKNPKTGIEFAVQKCKLDVSEP
jgi:hypothetical protein